MYKMLLAMTLCLLSSVAAAEQMYRWIDDQGVPQFGQQPPEGTTYQRIDVSSPPPPGGTLRAPAPLPEKTTTKAPLEEDESISDTALAAKRAEQCAKIRSNLQTMERNPRLSKTTDDGEIVRIGEEERQEMMDQARADLAEFCSE